jgi:hypothetical protein
MGTGTLSVVIRVAIGIIVGVESGKGSLLSFAVNTVGSEHPDQENMAYPKVVQESFYSFLD